MIRLEDWGAADADTAAVDKGLLPEGFKRCLSTHREEGRMSAHRCIRNMKHEDVHRCSHHEWGSERRHR